MVQNDKKNKIMELILQGYSTAEIAHKMGYSIGTIRNLYTELREEYDVNSKTEIALCYVGEYLHGVRDELDKLISVLPKKSNDTCTKK